MERYRLKSTVAPTTETHTVAEVMEHVREDSALAEAEIDAMIAAARAYVEARTNTTLLTSTWRLTLDAFPSRSHLSGLEVDRIDLYRPPVQSVSSITYVDEDGTTQTVDSGDYVLDNASDYAASVRPAYDEEWPATREQRGAVVVTYVAGYTLAANIPEHVRHALKMLVGHWYANREGVLTGTISKPIEFAVDALLGLHDVSPLG